MTLVAESLSSVPAIDKKIIKYSWYYDLIKKFLYSKSKTSLTKIKGVEI